MINKDLAKFKKELRHAFAAYYASEGCSCCRGSSHDADLERIAKLLNIPKYKDGSGYDVYKFHRKEKTNKS